MRKIPAVKVITHALSLVSSYWRVGLRIGIVWMGVLFALGLISDAVGPIDPKATAFGAPHVVFLLSALAGLIGISAIAVEWHRFVLRDEPGSPWRLDAAVWRYAGNTLLITLIIIIPFAILAAAASLLHPAVTILLLPAAVAAGAVALRLSIKLPAIALARKDFSFTQALAASEGNFWPLAAVFLMNAALTVASLLVLSLVIAALERVSPQLASIAGLALAMLFQIFYALFNASIFTALYGFLVEQRDFS